MANKWLLTFFMCCIQLCVFGQLFDDMKKPEEPTTLVFNVEAYTGIGYGILSYDSNTPPNPYGYTPGRSSHHPFVFPAFGANMLFGTKRIRGGGGLEFSYSRANRSFLDDTRLDMAIVKLSGRGEYTFSYGKKSSWGCSLQFGAFMPVNPIGTTSSLPLHAGGGLFYKLGFTPRLQFFFEEGMDFHWFTTMLNGETSRQNFFIALFRLGLNFGG